MFKSIGKAFTKFFKSDKRDRKLAMDNASKMAEAQLLEKNKKDSLLSRVEDVASVLSKKGRYIVKGRRDGKIARKYDETSRTLGTNKNEFRRFGTFSTIKPIRVMQTKEFPEGKITMQAFRGVQ